MLKRSTLVLVLAALILPVNALGGDWVFSVKPNLDIQGAQIGYEAGKFLPYFGIDYMSLSADFKGTDEDYNQGSSGLYLSHSGSINFDGTVQLFIPQIGTRYNFNLNETVRPYVLVSLLKAFATVDASGVEQDTYYNEDGSIANMYTDELMLTPEEKSLLESLLSFSGLSLGFGGEYYFAEQFSIGGEFILRWFFFSGDFNETDSQDFNGDGVEDWRSSVTSDLSGTLGGSTAAVVLNFHF